jgi:hypothetical protein
MTSPALPDARAASAASCVASSWSLTWHFFFHYEFLLLMQVSNNSSGQLQWILLSWRFRLYPYAIELSEAVHFLRR